MRYFLCGQTGNMNRGCEAIVRSTVKVLNRRNGDIYLATFAPEQDRVMSRELGITMLPYATYSSSLQRYFYAGIRKLFKKSLAGLGVIERPLFRRIEKEDVCLTIGGDTYCYGRPISSLALNKFTSKNEVKNILWCCSVEKKAIHGEILHDLKRYKYIFAREGITYQNLIEAGISPKSIIKCCDPAFFLDKKQVPLPEKFMVGNTVGINVSEMVINESNPCAYQNVIGLVNYILRETDMSVCLIPHVYSIKNNSNDYPILKKIYDEIGNDRVSMVNEEYDCEQLKYIISNCRFFVGARTHSTIAAYSSSVPTLVLGYSVKSKGIATDLFGTYEDFVLPYDELVKESILTEAFVKLVDKESDIKKQYDEFLPKYKQTLIEAVNTYVIEAKLSEFPFEICDKKQCTGCLACVHICPRNAISVKVNEEGFGYPSIDYKKCVDCGLCRSKCPVTNRYRDDNKKPKTMAVINKNGGVRAKSSSGGVFTAIAEHVLEQGGAVYGAGFDKEFNVVHRSCTGKDELEDLRGSKYVQSNIQGIYPAIEQQLENGQLVLFVGTPCQVGGLRAYLSKEYEGLYMLDFICHGVPSPLVWKTYVEYRERKAKSKVKRISFRNKETGWRQYSVVFEFENGERYAQTVTKDLYMRGYLSHVFLRPSCSECAFKQLHRQSDITLADFWGIEKVIPKWNDNKGISLCMIHSEKGSKLFDEIRSKLEIKEIEFEIAIKQNPSMLLSTKSNVLSSAFFRDLNKLQMNRLVEKYCGQSPQRKMYRKWQKAMKKSR